MFRQPAQGAAQRGLLPEKEAGETRLRDALSGAVFPVPADGQRRIVFRDSSVSRGLYLRSNRCCFVLLLFGEEQMGIVLKCAPRLFRMLHRRPSFIG